MLIGIVEPKDIYTGSKNPTKKLVVKIYGGIAAATLATCFAINPQVINISIAAFKRTATEAAQDDIQEVIEEFSLEDCIINGLKGVTSDKAALMVKGACNEKEKLHNEKIRLAKEEPINEIYGKKVKDDSVSFDGWEKLESGKWLVAIKNKMPKESGFIRYLRLRVGAGSSGYCNASKDYSFKVNVAPGESEYIGIEPFIPDADAMCVTFLDARAKKQSIYEYIQSVTLPSERPEMLQADPYGAYLNDASIPATEAASAASEVASATAPSSSN